MAEGKFADFKDRWYTPPKSIYNSEEEYLELKSCIIAITTTLLSQNRYDFYSALSVFYKSEDVYDNLSDWENNGCFLTSNDCYEAICKEHRIQPVEYDFERIRNPKILEQIKFVLELEQKRLAEKKQGYEFFVENESAIQKAIEEKNLA